MRIISDFHDYYDIGMQNGIDPQLPYRRFRQEEPLSSRINTDYSLFSANSMHRCLCIGFAGQLYPCIKLSDHGTTSFCFDVNQIDDSVFIELAKRNWEREIVRKEGLQSVAKHKKRTVARFFEHMFNTIGWFLPLFEQFKTAIFVHKSGSNTIILNERLNLYGFQKVLPPMEAFQELAMYVGARLTKPVIQEPPLSDKVKAEIHGFDKYSFRKGKTK